MTDPRQPAYDAVFEFIRSQPRDFMPLTVVDRNAMIWRAVHAALDAMGIPKPVGAPAPVATEATEAGSLHELVAAAIYERNNPGHQWANAHPDDRVAYGSDAEAAISVLQPGARITATLARMSEADVQRVAALYERWVKAGPPPLGTLINRWWDARLVELRNAILPPTDTTKEQ